MKTYAYCIHISVLKGVAFSHNLGNQTIPFIFKTLDHFIFAFYNNVVYLAKNNPW